MVKMQKTIVAYRSIPLPSPIRPGMAAKAPAVRALTGPAVYTGACHGQTCRKAIVFLIHIKVFADLAPYTGRCTSTGDSCV